MNASRATRKTLFEHNELVGRKYRLVSMIGRGGMAEVWEAVNLDLDAPVAIKLTRSDVTDEVLARRMVQEAKAVAQLTHPAIVQVYDAGMHHGAPYVVMERLRGRSLREVIDTQEPPDWISSIRILISILDALSYAHGRGLVHRDIKPDNVFLATVGSGKTQPKLLDFGVVKLIQESEHQLTQLGMALGSPAYMAPEQAAGRLDVDQRADVWGACITLFEVLTKRQPFRAPNYNALMRKILEEPAPLLSSVASSEQQESNPQLVATLEAILSKGLERRRSKRWQSAAELNAALARCLLDHGVDEDAAGNRVTQHLEAGGGGFLPSDSSSGPRRLHVAPRPRLEATHPKRWVVVGAAGALVLAGLSLWLWQSSSTEAQQPAAVVSERAATDSNPPTPDHPSPSPPDPPSAGAALEHVPLTPESPPRTARSVTPETAAPSAEQARPPPASSSDEPSRAREPSSPPRAAAPVKAREREDAQPRPRATPPPTASEPKAPGPDLKNPF